MSKPAPPISPTSDQARASSPSVGSGRSAPATDVQLLAEKVYRLFLADLNAQRRRAARREEG